MDYSRQVWGEEYEKEDGVRINNGVRALRSRTGIKRLELESGLIEPTVAAGTIIIKGSRVDESMVPLLAIFSSEQELYQRQPSQAQLDELSQILGKQPRWWIDYEDPLRTNKLRVSVCQTASFFQSPSRTMLLDIQER